MRTLVLASILVAAVASTASAQDVVGQKDKTWTWSERLTSGTFRIHSPKGEITVGETSGDRIEVRAEKDAGRGDIEDIAFRVITRNDGITVCAVFEDSECNDDGSSRSQRNWSRNSRDRASVNITVRLPKGLKLRAASGNGVVTVSNIGGDTHAASGNGRVRVSNIAGSVDAASGNGEVTVEGAQGPVTASSGNGDVTVTTSMGPVDASSGNGDIRVAMERLTGTDDMSFSTGNGTVRITVPDGFAAEVEANTGNGRFATDFAITVRGRITPTNIRGTIGDGGGRRVRMSSGNGNLEIRKRD